MTVLAGELPNPHPVRQKLGSLASDVAGDLAFLLGRCHSTVSLLRQILHIHILIHDEDSIRWVEAFWLTAVQG